MRNTMPIPSGISLPPSFFLPGRRSAGIRIARIARFAARLAGVGLLMQVAGCTGLVPGLPG